MTLLLRAFFHSPVYIYRWRLGWLFGHRFLLLVHVGRRTGRRHETVLEVMEYRKAAREAVVMSGFGGGANWLRNITAGRSAEVVIGRDRFVAAHRLLTTDEAADVVNAYERRHRFLAPLIRLVLTRLLGWPYHGFDSERRLLVGQLPLVCFRPAS